MKHLKTPLPEGLQERRRGRSCNALTCDIIDVVLALLHVVDILLEGDDLVTRLGCLVAQELGNLDTVGRVLMDTKLDALAELLIELYV